MTGQLPTRLTTQPIIDAIVEIRFTASVDASLLLPGLLAQRLGRSVKVERLPLADLPEEIRFQQDLKYQPLIRILADGFIYLVGSHSFCVGCQLPYPGWSAFKEKIVSGFAILNDAKIVDAVERHSIKYIDLLELGDPAQLSEYLNLTVDVAGISATNCPIGLNVSIQDDECYQLLHIAAPVDVEIIGGMKKRGTMIHVDTISKASPMSFAEFYSSLEDRFDKLHLINKRQFFGLLKSKAMEQLGAIYE